MNDQTDSQLLRAYAEHRSEPAFTELVRRHVDFVYSAAQRMVCDSHLAEDVTQGVFVALAKNAAQLTERPVLSGWLHRTAQNIAAQTVRTDVRRRAREQEAAAMNELLATEPDALWEHIAPHLDAALGDLSEPDRDALLLRYFERKSAREIAQALGVSDEAAQKRVSRAVERLREFFAKRGVTVGASGLVVVLSASAVQAAPVGLAVTISAAATIAGTAVQTSTVIAATKAIAMTTLQKTLITAALAAAVGAGIYEAHKKSTLRDENASLQQEIAQLKMEKESRSNRPAPVAVAKSPPDGQLLELLRLRGEVGVLRQQTNELENAVAGQQKAQPPSPKPATERPPAPALPDDYPKTPDGATTNIFNTWARGDWDAFFTNFAEPGVPRETYEKLFGPYTNLLAGMEVVSIGQPTNSFGPDMWFVPYKIRFKDGSEKEFRLHVAQDPRTQRWYFKGGF